MKEGKLVASELAVKLIRKAIAIHGVRRYLIDGFPRNRENWEKFQQILRDEVIVKGLIYFECTNEVMTKRILERNIPADTPESVKAQVQNHIN